MEIRQYTKIALHGSGDDTKVHLHFNEPTEAGGRQEHDIESKDAPLESFLTAMKQMDQFVAAMLEYPTTYAENCKVHIVSLSRKADRIGVILSVKKVLTNGLSFNHNTPKYNEPNDEGLDGAADMPDGMMDCITRLIAEADRYRAGERSQMGMEFEGEDES